MNISDIIRHKINKKNQVIYVLAWAGAFNVILKVGIKMQNMDVYE